MMKFECDIKFWGSRENNIIQAIKGYNPGHVAISLTIDGAEPEIIKKLEILKQQGVPVYHYERDGQKQSQVYFSFWPYEEDKLGQKIEKPKKSKQATGSLFYKLSREIHTGLTTYKRKFATPYDDATDQRLGKLPNEGEPLVILQSDNKEKYTEARQNARRKRGKRQTLWSSPTLKLSVNATLSESQATDFLTEYNYLYSLANSDETRRSLNQAFEELFSIRADQENSKAEIIKAFNYKEHNAYDLIQVCHQSIREEEALFKQIKQSEDPEKKQILKQNHTQLKYKILLEQHLLSCLGYSQEAALGQPADDIVAMPSETMDLDAALDKMLALSEPEVVYEMTGQNCSSSALAVIAASINDSKLTQYTKLLAAAEVSPQQKMRTPHGVYKLLTQKPDKQTLRPIDILQKIIKRLKEIVSSVMKHSAHQKPKQ